MDKFEDMDMKSNVAAGVLTALVYAQVALCFAGAATVLLRDRIEAQHVAVGADGPVTTAKTVRL